MRLKSFYAKTMTEAMQMVRDTLGEDAIIVATREENGGKSIRVTAAVDYVNYADQEPSPPRKEEERTQSTLDTWLQYDEEEEGDNNVLEEVTDILLRHAVPEDVTDQILSCVSVLGLQDAGQSLTHALENLFNFIPIPQKSSAKTLMLVGPPGAGKTLTAAKLATRAVMQGQTVQMLTTDTQRAGGFEQLQAFSRILKIPLQRVESPGELLRATEKIDRRGTSFVIVDTAGVNPFDREDVKALSGLVQTGDTDPILVLPGGADAAESGDMARIFAALGVRKLVASRLDISRRLGGLLAAAHQGGLAFSDIGRSANPADGLHPLSPQSLARLLMPSNPPAIQRAAKASTLSTHTKSNRKTG